MERTREACEREEGRFGGVPGIDVSWWIVGDLEARCRYVEVVRQSGGMEGEIQGRGGDWS